MTEPLTYRQAGVDVGAAGELVSVIAGLVEATHGPEVEPGPPAYAGLYRLPAGPLLAATCDGVGTKLIVASALGRFEGIGVDLVAMNVNDLVAVGARPLFFLDYVAVGRLEADTVAAIVRGAAAACRESGCALLGGETAEMPGLYRPGDLDVAGFAVGVVDPDLRPDAGAPRPGDRVLALPSSGIHANGLSLARAALDRGGLELDDPLPGGTGTVGDALLEPTALYPGRLPALPAEHRARALAHVTGGGIGGRGAALLPDGVRMDLDLARLPRHPIFDLIADAGRIERAEMASTFNLGAGFLAVVPPEAAEHWRTHDAGWVEAGEIRAGERGVDLHG